MAATKTAKKTPAAPAEKATKTEVAAAKKTAAPTTPAPRPKVKAPAPVHSTGTALTAKQLDNGQDPKLRGIRLHGKEFVGTVIGDKANKTVTVEWERRRLIPKYERYEKRYSRAYAHNPEQLSAKLGDTVRIVETRPLSKTKNFVVTEVIARAEAQQ